MDIAKILKGKYPDRKWALNGDTYDGLVMLDGLPKPSETELESHWADVQAEELKTKANAETLTKLELIDKQSIRGIREWIAAQPNAEKFTKDLEADAVIERAKILK